VQKLYGWSTERLYRYANDNLYAVDFDERLKKVAKTMMIIAGDGKANVIGTSSLDVREWQNSEARTKIGEFSKDERDGDFDLVLTNPPFAGKISGKSQLAAYDLYELAATGALASDDEEDPDDEGDTETEKLKKRKKVNGMKRDILFIERCLDLLKPGGRTAIVLPQGNLNNLGTRALRTYIAGRARLLAVVGLHVNSFKPFTGTKTSVVFLQKWGGNAGEILSDYPVFMATSQRSGKNNSGQYTFKTDEKGNQVDEEGVPIVESGRPAAIDHDLDEIADAFLTWGREQGFKFLAED
jgi:type I restriction enzyme M protein